MVGGGGGDPHITRNMMSVNGGGHLHSPEHLITSPPSLTSPTSDSSPVASHMPHRTLGNKYIYIYICTYDVHTV